ncbi:MAG: hypothetical protein KAH06_10485, partial [Desulfobacterales bacterium]|nr:hypothetical protein [Desulfobacterales bacterium]
FMTLKSVWYRLDHTDKDVKTFLHYLIEGIAEKYEGFGQETIMRIESARVLYREIEAVLTVFLCELEKHVQDDLFIVLDDYHLIQDSLEINEAMSFLIERFLANIHIILISRSDAVFPLSRLRAMRDVVDITEDDLSFTVSEIEDLFRCLFDVSLEEKSLLHLYRKTGGWVSGLILFYHSLKGKTSEEIETALVSMDSSQQIILTYLEENVFSLLSEELQEFLIKTSILTHIGVDFCNRLLQIENAKNILEKLVNNHLFTIPVDTQRRSYQYHHLFQEFLQAKLETIKDKTTVGILHENAAKLYEENDDIENALGHYLSAGKMDDACRLLGSIGRKLLWAGRLNLINSYLALIPESYLQNEPWIQYMQAQSLDLCGKSFQAIKAYKKALAMFRYKKSEQGETLCLMELGRNYFMTGDLQRAEDRFKELLKYENLEHQHRIDILGQMIFITSYLGKMDESDRYYDEAEKNLPDDEVLRKIYNALLHLYKSFRYHFSGDNKKALETGKKTKAVFEEMEIYQLVALYYQMASDSYWFMGDFSKGLNAAQTGLKIVEEKG